MDTGQNEVLFHSIKEIILHHRQRVFRLANSALLETYWSIGKLIVEDEQNGNAMAEYGKATLRILAQSLTLEFGKGFDESNLRNIRAFYKAFPIRDALRHELSQSYRSRYCLAHVAAETITEAFTQNNYESKRFGTVPMNCATAAAQLFEK